MFLFSASRAASSLMVPVIVIVTASLSRQMPLLPKAIQYLLLNACQSNVQSKMLKLIRTVLNTHKICMQPPSGRQHLIHRISASPIMSSCDYKRQTQPGTSYISRPLDSGHRSHMGEHWECGSVPSCCLPQPSTTLNRLNVEVFKS